VSRPPDWEIHHFLDGPAHDNLPEADRLEQAGRSKLDFVRFSLGPGSEDAGVRDVIEGLRER
jgi:hypothetical protein